MVLIIITLADGEQVYTKSIEINKQGDVKTDDNIFDITNILHTRIAWVETHVLNGMQKA